MAVGPYLPHGHVAYVRIMNPVRRSDGQLNSWSSIASPAIEVNATTTWNELVDETRSSNPEIGTIERRVAEALIRILRTHTAAPADCFFLVWEGYAGMRDDLRATVKIEMYPGREMLVLGGTSMMVSSPSTGTRTVDEHSGGFQQMAPGRSGTIFTARASTCLVPKISSKRCSRTMTSRPTGRRRR